MILTPTQEQVLRLRAEGLTHAEVAGELGISEQTVKNHVSNVYTALDVSNLPAVFSLLGWLNVPEQRESCEFVGKCGRPHNHRGHHGGFRPI